MEPNVGCAGFIRGAIELHAPLPLSVNINVNANRSQSELKRNEKIEQLQSELRGIPLDYGSR